MGNTTYRCSVSVNGTAYLNNGPALVMSRVAPLNFAQNQFTCTYSRNGNWNLNRSGAHWVGGSSASRRLQPGVYCATGNITLSVGSVSGHVTLVANGNIDVGADYPTLRAFQHGVVVFANGNSNSAIVFDGMAPSLVGHVYAPRGRVNLSGRASSVQGSVVAERIRINGDDASVVAGGTPN